MLRVSGLRNCLEVKDARDTRLLRTSLVWVGSLAGRTSDVSILRSFLLSWLDFPTNFPDAFLWEMKLVASFLGAEREMVGEGGFLLLFCACSPHALVSHWFPAFSCACVPQARYPLFLLAPVNALSTV